MRGCPDECIACGFWAFDREETAGQVYSVRTHRRRLMLEIAVGWAR